MRTLRYGFSFISILIYKNKNRKQKKKKLNDSKLLIYLKVQYTQADAIVVLVNFFITRLFYSSVFQIPELGSAGLIRVITWHSSDSLGNQHKLVINRIIYAEASGMWKQGDNQKICKCSLYFAFYCFHEYYFPIKTFFHLFSNPLFFLIVFTVPVW